MNTPQTALFLALALAPHLAQGQTACTQDAGLPLLRAANQRLQTLFGATVPPPHLNIHAQAHDLRLVHGAPHDSQGAGLYRAAAQEIHVACREGEKPVFEPVLRHEATHHYLRQAFGQLPPWLEEGVAAYMEAGPLTEGLPASHVNRERLAEFRALVRQGELPSLRDKFSHEVWREPSSADYALGWALVFSLLHLVEPPIQQQRRDLLRFLLSKAGSEGDSAYRRFLAAMTGQEGEEGERRWRREIWQLPH